MPPAPVPQPAPPVQPVQPVQPEPVVTQPEPAPAPAPMPERRALPHTASTLPMIMLIGATLIALGFALRTTAKVTR